MLTNIAFLIEIYLKRNSTIKLYININMTQFYKQYRYKIASLLIKLPLGLLFKLYSGAGQQWLNNYAENVLYKIF